MILPVADQRGKRSVAKAISVSACVLGLSLPAAVPIQAAISPETVGHRGGVGELASNDERLVGLRPGLLGIAQREKRVREPSRAHHARVEGVGEGRASVPYVVV